MVSRLGRRNEGVWVRNALLPPVRSALLPPTAGRVMLSSMRDAPMTSSLRVSRSELLAIVAGWTLIAALFAGHNYLSAAANGRPVALEQAGWWSVAEWYTWALLTPLVALLVRWVRPATGSRMRGLLLLAAWGVVIAALQVGLEYSADRLAVLL